MISAALTLHPVDETRYVTTDPDTGVDRLVVLIEGDGDVPAYVHFGLRAHRLIS